MDQNQDGVAQAIDLHVADRRIMLASHRLTWVPFIQLLLSTVELDKPTFSRSLNSLSTNHNPRETVAALQTVPIDGLQRRIAAGFSQDNTEVTAAARAVTAEVAGPSAILFHPSPP